MVQFDNQHRQIKIKIVYYGPALGGKTTCLQHIHSVIDPDRRTKLYSLNTTTDRTLFFDLLSLKLGRLRGYELAMQLYTVPGQVQYDATRRAVLSGADGVVFVADSQAHCHQANLDSLDNLWTNLLVNGLDRSSLPLVFHYNKRDLEPLLSVAEMDEALNPRSWVAVPTVAVRGDGVMDGFAAIVEATLAAVADKLGVAANPAAIERLQEQARRALQPYLPASGEAADEPGLAVTVTAAAGDGSQALSHESLVGEAVRANLAMTDLNARLDTTRRTLEHTIHVLSGIHDFAIAMAGEKDGIHILRQLLTTSLHLLGVTAGAVMAVPRSGLMHEVAVHGIGRDPLLHVNDETGEALAVRLAGRGTPCRVAREIDVEDGGMVLSAIESAGFSSALVMPLAAHDTVIGLLTIYADGGRLALDDDDLQLVSVLGTTAALSCATARSWQSLELLNRSLEKQVEARTIEVQQRLEEAQQLAADLEHTNRRLDEAYGELAELDRVKDELISRLSAELRNPVSSVVAAAKVLDTLNESMPPKGVRCVAIIRNEAEKLHTIISSVLQASVLSRGNQGVERSELSLEDLFKRLLPAIRDRAEARSITIKILIASGLTSIVCDRSSMETALRAVLTNAVEFNRDGGEVTVAVRRVQRDDVPWVVLKVSDTGVGIAKDEVDRVFEMFWQGSNPEAGRARGVGLGLAIAKMVFENHGGSVSLTSTVGEGATVTLSLPQNA